MVVLAAAVVTKTGKGKLAGRCWLRSSRLQLPLTPLRLLHRAALVSRQFVDMTRIRIEGLLAAFPKLVGAGKQHTYVETENVRYLYQPIEVRAIGRRRACSQGGATAIKCRCRAAASVAGRPAILLGALHAWIPAIHNGHGAQRSRA